MSKVVQQYFEDLTPEQIAQLDQLFDLYKEWNDKINVISRKDIDSLYLKHVLHSLALAALFEFQPGMQVMDIGAGGGFPSIPLAILFPETQFTAVDSIGKKLTVIREVAAAAHIPNIETIHSRAEDIKNKQFDVVVSRAVAPIKDLLYYTKRLLRKPVHVSNLFPKPTPQSRIPIGLICLKGGNLTNEIFESDRNPLVWPISSLFDDPYFEEKYVLQFN